MRVSSGGRVVGDQVASGATLDVMGGTISSTTVDGGTIILNNTSATADTTFTISGGTVRLASGYADPRAWTVSNRVSLLVSSGATLTSATVGLGGSVFANGTISSTTVVQGGTLELGSSVTTINTAVSGGNVIVDSGATWNQSATAVTQMASGGSVLVYSGGTLASQTLLAGASATVRSGGVLTGVTTVSSGAGLLLNGTAGSGTINLAGDGARVTINGTQMPTNVISGFTTNDQIDLRSVERNSISSVSRSSNVVTITLKDGTQYNLNAPGVDSYGYQLQDDGTGGTIYTTCFAEGTLIATPSGAIAVEDLAEGVLVETPKGAMPVMWLGHRSIVVREQRVPEENWLVRVKAGALSEGVPSRDLLVTQEHCLVFEGWLVPVRMLVNGVSVLIDRTIGSYTYYRVELETHEAIWAEGALTESYLDTGNRVQFANADIVAVHASDVRVSGGSDMLPLEVSRGFVEPVWRSIAARAGVHAPELPTLTEDADLHLVSEDGVQIRAFRASQGRYVFTLPEHVETVVLMSRTGRPAVTVGPFVDDRRDLGVLVGDVSLFGFAGTARIEAHLSSDLPGWDVREASACRWTNGAAVLPVGRAAVGESRLLSLQVLAAGPYAVEECGAEPYLVAAE